MWRGPQQPLHMDEQTQDDQLEPTYSSSVPIRDVTLKTCQKQWTIKKSGKRGLGISVLMARHDVDRVYQEETCTCKHCKWLAGHHIDSLISMTLTNGNGSNGSLIVDLLCLIRILSLLVIECSLVCLSCCLAARSYQKICKWIFPPSVIS